MAGPTSVRFCNEMLELCGYQEDALNEWKTADTGRGQLHKRTIHPD